MSRLLCKLTDPKGAQEGNIKERQPRYVLFALIFQVVALYDGLSAHCWGRIAPFKGTSKVLLDNPLS